VRFRTYAERVNHSATLTLLGRTMGTKVFVLPLQVAATASVTFLTIRSIGVEAYATVGLLRAIHLSRLRFVRAHRARVVWRGGGPS
jgi:hypothetical protein